ncbi:oligosaccharide flippase family protein [Pseudomonas chlororaphis]|uniref:lipopolysaccharide biosynthesis protein n=1 Tax=Pseudomonas chlororaphis TaxID=587753 RepID=UPI00209B7E76|nr:oligosaccharide flippase family protein [Pseudomonas chlororaphis]MCO7570718.1 oligosaccharide flippase family protein [Pseudomonas chlororaphis]MCO7588762.1 oligosaccharide flippase family protein [Pseudomonas chlororaphis]MCO7611933.1 oligosaccharide flippase family protein [Pseudomonas chlororaphis]
MSNIRKLVSNTAIYFGANVLNAAIPFFLLPILTRVLSPADYGTIAMFGISLSIISAFTGLSVHGAIGVRYFQLSKEELAEYIVTCIGILVVSTTTILLVTLGLSPWLPQLTGLPIDWLLVAVVVSGFQFLGNIRLSLWQVAGEAKKYGAFQVTQTLLNAGGSLVLILLIGMAWEGRVIAQTLAIGLFGVIGFCWLWKDGLLRKPVTWRVHCLDALKFGVPLIPHAIGGLLIVATDRLIIVRLLDVGQAGLYMVALQFGQVMGLVTESFNKVYAPWLMKSLSSKEDIPRSRIVGFSYLYMGFLFVMATILGLLAPWIMSFLVGSEFKSSSELVIYIAIGFAFGGCYYTVTNYIFFENKNSILALITLLTGLINIPLMYFLVERNGLVGAAQAFMLTQCFSFVGTWWLSNKVHPMPWFNLKV